MTFVRLNECKLKYLPCFWMDCYHHAFQDLLVHYRYILQGSTLQLLDFLKARNEFGIPDEAIHVLSTLYL